MEIEKVVVIDFNRIRQLERHKNNPRLQLSFCKTWRNFKVSIVKFKLKVDFRENLKKRQSLLIFRGFISCRIYFYKRHPLQKPIWKLFGRSRSSEVQSLLISLQEKIIRPSLSWFASITLYLPFGTEPPKVSLPKCYSVTKH